MSVTTEHDALIKLTRPLTVREIEIKQTPQQGLLYVWLPWGRERRHPRWRISNNEGVWSLYQVCDDYGVFWESKRNLAPLIHKLPELRQAVADEINAYRAEWGLTTEEAS